MVDLQDVFCFWQDFLAGFERFTEPKCRRCEVICGIKSCVLEVDSEVDMFDPCTFFADERLQ